MRLALKQKHNQLYKQRLFVIFPHSVKQTLTVCQNDLGEHLE